MINTLKVINSFTELEQNLIQHKKSYLLLYKKGTEISDCAYEKIAQLSGDMSDIQLLTADVNQVRDIHTQYSITSAPSLLEFEGIQYKNVIKGCHDKSYYQAVFENAVFTVQAEKSGKPVKSVTVYSTPTCSWCNTLKSYLRKNRIRFSDVDVSRDQKAAQEMVNRSGQQGVPQTVINGQLVIGFDKKKIDELLEINS